MKSFAFVFVSLFLFHAARSQKTIQGTWEGVLAAGGNGLRIVVHLKEQGSAYSATLDSPDQGAKGIPVSGVQTNGDSLHLDVAVANAKLTGRFTNDSTLSGQWQQGGARLPIVLKKTTAVAGNIAAQKRPQTPLPPFPYSSKDVLFHNADRSIRFGATITQPLGKGPFPAVVLITGSGPQNRDEELFGHKPFAVLADDLTQRGFLVLRADDRGVGQSTGNHTTATSNDFAEDVVAALAYLRSLPDVDKKKIGLLGHSEGGMIAQIVGARQPELAFLVLMAAPGIPVLELMALQNEAMLRSAGLQKEAVQQYLDLYRPLTTALASTPPAQAETVAMEIVDNWLKKTPKETVVQTTAISDEASKQRFVSTFSKQVSTPWFRYFLQYNPADYLEKIKTKLLALNGDKDVQVTSGANLAGMEASLKKGKAQYRLIELKGLNHLFQRCHTCTVNEYGELEETIAPEALEAVGQWLVNEVKNK